MTKKFLSILSVLLLCAATARADIITLQDGRILHVKVVETTDAGLTVERLDNGGKVTLRWEHLRDADRKRLRIQYGLEEEESEADLVMVGHRIYPRQSDFTDGLVTGSDNEYFTMMVRGREERYRKDALRKPPEEREVSVFEVYTPEQLYQKKIAELAADADIEVIFEFAKYCTRITMYDKAIEHFTKVKELDPGFKAEYIANQLKRLEILDRDKETRKLMREADQLGNSQKFDQCLARLREIAASGSVAAEIKAEAAKKVTVWEKKRHEYYSNAVVQGYYRYVRKTLEDLSRDKRIYEKDEKERYSIDKAMSFIRSQLHKDAVKHLAEKLGLDPKNEVEKMWKDRKRKSRDPVSYGSGTFIIAGVKEAQKDGGAAQNDAARQVQDYLRRLNRGQQQQQEQQAEIQGPKLKSKDEWWASVESIVRLYWMLAYWVENSDQFEVTKRSFNACEQCGSTGTIKILGTQGSLQRFTCPRCQGNKGDTVLYYK